MRTEITGYVYNKVKELMMHLGVSQKAIGQ